MGVRQSGRRDCFSVLYTCALSIHSSVIQAQLQLQLQLQLDMSLFNLVQLAFLLAAVDNVPYTNVHASGHCWSDVVHGPDGCILTF